MLSKLGFAERFLVLIGGAVLVSVGQWFFENIQLQSQSQSVLRVAASAPNQTHNNNNSSNSNSNSRTYYHHHHNETLVTQLLLIENDPNSELSVERIQNLFPKPVDSVAIYNFTTAQRLRHLLLNNNNNNDNETIVLCVNGGSSTAGGGRSAGKQFYQHLPQHFPSLIEIIERGHGNRNSLHSAQMAAWYWPTNMNILIWEFSINDVVVVETTTRTSNNNNNNNTVNKNKKKAADERNQLILWLNQVARIQPQPPLVILVYLWNSPFAMMTNNNNSSSSSSDGYNHHRKIKSDVFESHQLLAANYDFVVGHVHLARYMTNELAWNYDLSDLFFLADRHHPSPLGHAVLTYLLLDLIHDEQRKPIDILAARSDNSNQKSSSSSNNSNISLAQFEWTCGTDTPEKRFFQQYIADQQPVASFTMELPRHNDESVYIPGMFTTTQFKDRQVVNFGRANPHRQDRQNAVVLPCCDSILTATTTATATNKTNPTATSTLDLFQNNPSSSSSSSSFATSISLRALQLAVLPAGPETYLRVYLDEQDVTAHDWLTTAPSEWDCLWNYKGIYPQVAWVLLVSGPRNVTNIRLCSTKPSNCGQPSKQQEQQQQRNSQALMSMVAY